MRPAADIAADLDRGVLVVFPGGNEEGTPACITHPLLREAAEALHYLQSTSKATARQYNVVPLEQVERYLDEVSARERAEAEVARLTEALQQIESMPTFQLTPGGEIIGPTQSQIARAALDSKVANDG